MLKILNLDLNTFCISYPDDNLSIKKIHFLELLIENKFYNGIEYFFSKNKKKDLFYKIINEKSSTIYLKMEKLETKIGMLELLKLQEYKIVYFFSIFDVIVDSLINLKANNDYEEMRDKVIPYCKKLFEEFPNDMKIKILLNISFINRNIENVEKFYQTPIIFIIKLFHLNDKEIFKIFELEDFSNTIFKLNFYKIL